MSDTMAYEADVWVIEYDQGGPRVQLIFNTNFMTYGIPAGGTTGQALVKTSDNDREVNWGNVAAGGGGSVDDTLHHGGVWTLTRDTGLDIDFTNEEAVDHDTIVTDWGHTIFLDGSSHGFLRGLDGVQRHYIVGDGRWGSTPGQNHDPANPFGVVVTEPRPNDVYGDPTLHQEISVQGVPAGITWCSGGPVLDCGGGVGFMLLHVEHEGGGLGHPWLYWTIDCARVVDDGTTITITYLGALNSHALTIENAELLEVTAFGGAGTLIPRPDGFVYCGIVDHMADGSGWNPAIMRGTRADIVAAVHDATPYVPDFRKYNGEAPGDPWIQPALGGDYTPLPWNTGNESLAAGGDWMELPDGRILVVGVNSYYDSEALATSYYHGYSEGTDLLNLSAMTRLEDQTDTEWIYTNAWSGDVDNPKLATRPTVQVDMLQSFQNIGGPGNGRWLSNTIRRLTYAPVVLPTTIPPFPDVPTEAEILAWVNASIVPGLAEHDFVAIIQDPGATVVDIGTFDTGGPTGASADRSGLVIAIWAGTEIILPPTIENSSRTWEVMNGTSFTGEGDITVSVAAGDTMNTPTTTVPEGVAVTYRSLEGAQWFGLYTGNRSPLGAAALLEVGTTAGTVAAGDDSRIVNALQPGDIVPPGLGIIPDSRLSLQATYGSPAYEWDNVVAITTAAIPVGEGVLAYGHKQNRVDLRRILFHVVAGSNNFIAGNVLEIVCYALDEDRLPGLLAWMVPITLGTTTGDISHDLGASSGLFLPEDGYYIGAWNRSTNAGTIALRNYYPANRVFSANSTVGSLDRNSAIRTPSAATAQADMSGHQVNSAPNTSTRLGITFTAPGLWLR